MNSVRVTHVFILLLLFWCAWLYTEIVERFERDAFNAEVNDFIHKGDRFTRENGNALEQRIERLEREIDPNSGG